MTKRNIYGLPRTIPESVKRQIRQNSGFGCVKCGNGIYTYEHVDPPFYKATAHEADKMTLLCYSCQGKSSSGMLSKESIKAAMLHPFYKARGFSSNFFDVGIKAPYLKFAGVTLTNVTVPIQIGDEILFKLKGPEQVGAPFLFPGTFYNSTGELSLRIVDNVWQANSDNWDVEVTGTTITIREKLGNIHLRLVSDSPNGLIVERLNMYCKGINIIGDKDMLVFVYPNGGRGSFSNCLMDNGYCGIHIG